MSEKYEITLKVKRYDPDEPDTFTVIISEPVDVDDIKGLSFTLIKGSSGERINIEPLDKVKDLGGESEIYFLIKDLKDKAPKEGDSLMIYAKGPVIDKKKNKAHEKNRPVPIDILDGNLDEWPQIKLALICDKNGDGIGDSINVKFDGSYIPL